MLRLTVGAVGFIARVDVCYAQMKKKKLHNVADYLFSESERLQEQVSVYHPFHTKNHQVCM